MKTDQETTVDKDSERTGKKLEELHRSLFTHPDLETWNATKSIAQLSFLKQVRSFGGSNSGHALNYLHKVEHG